MITDDRLLSLRAAVAGRLMMQAVENALDPHGPLYPGKLAGPAGAAPMAPVPTFSEA